MKFDFLLKKAVCFSLLVIAVVFSTYSVLAVDLDGDGIDDEIATAQPVETEPEYTEPVETEIVYVEETTEYIPETVPQEVTEEYQQPVETVATDEPYEEETQAYTQQAQYVETQQETTYPQTPTVEKIVSEKKYSTNYTAGMVSWICVGIGVIVVLSVLISTKVSTRKSMGR